MVRRCLPLLTAGMLISMSACSKDAAPASIGNNAEMMADALEQKADNLEAMAAAAANDSTADLLDGAADNFDDQADNVRALATGNAD